MMNYYDVLLAKKLNGGGGGSSITVEELNVTENGTYTAQIGTAYSPVNVNVSGEPSGTLSIMANGSYDVKSYAFADVNVSGGGGDSKENEILTRTISGAYSNSAITDLGSYAFAFCSSLGAVDLPSLTKVGANAFYECASLSSVSLPNVTNINSSAFYHCSTLQSFDAPSLKNVSGAGLMSCTNLSEVSVPALTSLGQSAFVNCYALKMISLPVVTNISASSIFAGCSKLESVYMRLGLSASTVPTIKSNIFNTTPIVNSTYLGYFGSIYVLSSMLDKYQSATNWVNFSARMVGV